MLYSWACNSQCLKWLCYWLRVRQSRNLLQVHLKHWYKFTKLHNDTDHFVICHIIYMFVILQFCEFKFYLYYKSFVKMRIHNRVVINFFLQRLNLSNEIPVYYLPAPTGWLHHPYQYLLQVTGILRLKHFLTVIRMSLGASLCCRQAQQTEIQVHSCC